MNNILNKAHISAIQRSFETQSPRFDSDGYHLSKKEYLEYMVMKTCPAKTDNILEVGAGTCICGCAFAPNAGHITCLDITPAMLEAGKRECEKTGIQNITFVKGTAEELPFLDNSFDIVISRLAFHHFIHVKEIFAEMKRTLRPGGKLVLMDMTVENEDLKSTVNHIETLRDPSHTGNLSISEMRNLYSQNGVTLELQEQIDVPVSLKSWMDLTSTPEKSRQEICGLMTDDINGKRITGFSPYYNQGEIYFNHHWVFNLGKK